MGLLTDLVKTSIKIAAAPIYIPLKIAETLEQPPQYNHWYHDSGREQEDSSASSQSKSD
ncbi:MAG: hypothetical protein WB579_01930 [Bryobacteraceae bacterium]